MAARLASLSVFATLIVLGSARVGAAQDFSCCAARLDVCQREAGNDWALCINDCYAARNDAQEECDRHPSPSCALIGPLFGRCLLRCDHGRLRDRLFCFVRFRVCLNQRDCENSPTPTRTVTRTQTPTFTPELPDTQPSVRVVPTETPLPPPS